MRIRDILKSFGNFWGNVLFSKNRKEYLASNMDKLGGQIVVLVILLLLSVVVYKASKPTVRGLCRIALTSSEEMDAMSSAERRVVGVEAKKVVSGTTLRQVRSIGTMKANAEVVIKSEIPGKIKEILFTEGGEVKAGDELIRFEDDLYIAGKEKAEATYMLHKAEYERMNRLYKQNAGSLKDYEKTLAEMNISKAQLSEAKFQLSRTSIRAPFSGVIGIMKVNVGNIVQQHTELVTIVDNSNVKVEFMIPARFIEDIAVGQSVEISVDSFPDKTFSGMVDAVDSEVDTKNHSILVRAVIPNPNGLLKHGLFANVTLVTGEKSDVLLIDEESLDREGSREFVWAIDEKGRAYMKQVLTGARDDHGVEVVAGLKEGEYVVTAGHLKLSNGVKVRILNAPVAEREMFDGEKEAVRKAEAAEEAEDNSEKGFLKKFISKFTKKPEGKQGKDTVMDNRSQRSGREQNATNVGGDESDVDEDEISPIEPDGLDSESSEETGNKAEA
ncbi:MAG: efflux RND transporter periplasmic adaptor subunit [Holosporales bacterium]|jgi:membrane fusion protein (multidrug efflux system)|nr:efflux RND transporter periplasmic adaptor subunit [Holosporales bacterium]